MHSIDNCTAVILAGGESRRMGEDKAALMLAGESLIHRAIQSVNPLFEHLLISVRQPRDHLLFPQLIDRGEGGGPMRGITTALERVNTPWVFVMACDMPFVSSEMVLAMSERRTDQQVVASVVDGFVQPLAAFYSKSCLPLMQQQMEAGDRSLKRFIENVDSTLIEGQELRSLDPELISFMDLDCKQDVEKAEGILRSME